MKTDIIEDLCKINLSDDKVLTLEFQKKTIDVPEAEKIVEGTRRISGNIKHANLIDTRKMLLMTRSARKHFAKQRGQDVVCIALLINSKLQSISANMYMKFNKPVIPTKVFTDKNLAVNWLKNSLEKNEII